MASETNCPSESELKDMCNKEIINSNYLHGLFFEKYFKKMIN